MAVKITITLDDRTIAELNQTAARLSKPKSEVVREALHDYHLKSDRLTESERRTALKLLDEYRKKPSTRSAAETDRELGELRKSRRRGWRRDRA